MPPLMYLYDAILLQLCYANLQLHFFPYETISPDTTSQSDGTRRTKRLSVKNVEKLKKAETFEFFLSLFSFVRFVRCKQKRNVV